MLALLELGTDSTIPSLELAANSATATVAWSSAAWLPVVFSALLVVANFLLVRAVYRQTRGISSSAEAAKTSAAATEKAASATQKSVRVSLLTHLAQVYSSDPMLEGVLALWHWKVTWEKKDKDFAEQFEQLRKSRDRYEKDDENVKSVDQGRRKFVHHMHEIKRLIDWGIIDEEEVRFLISKEKVETLITICEPLERAINRNYDMGTYDYFREYLGHEYPKHDG